MAMADSPGAYAEKWDKWYGRSDEQAHGLDVAEWHLPGEAILPLLAPHLGDLAALSRAPEEAATACSGADVAGPRGARELVDVGCGSSTIALAIQAAWSNASSHSGSASGTGLPLRVTLLDISADLVAHIAGLYADRGDVACAVADCRALPQRDGTVAVVLDKGTLDALDTDTDRAAMLADCVRVLAPDGLIVSVAFAAPRRLTWLREQCAALGLVLRTHVVAEGDPAEGFPARFVCLLSRAGHAFGSVPYTPSALTGTLLSRLAATGLLCAPEGDDDQVADLFAADL